MSPVFFFLAAMCLMVQSEAAGVNITAEAGQNVTLPCEVTVNSSITVVKWISPDPKEKKYVLFYTDGKIKPGSQLESFKNRVSQVDGWNKTGNVSLILKNVTTEDNGTYECKVKQKRGQIESISNITLTVKNTRMCRYEQDKQGGRRRRRSASGICSQGHREVSLVVGPVVGLVLVFLMVVGGVV